jgi:hypothetical protein
MACLSARRQLPRDRSLRYGARIAIRCGIYSIIFNDIALCSIGHIDGLESQQQRENRAISA